MFSIKVSLDYGWAKVKENMQISVLATLLMLAVSAISGGKRRAVGTIVSLAAVVFGLIIRIGYTKIFLRMSDGEKPKFSEIFSEYELFWKFLGVAILTALAVAGGLILLIIPGLIWAVRFSFAPFVVVDTKMGPVAAMKESYAITKGNFWKLVLFWLAVIGINLIGVILLGIGLLFTIPMTTFATIFVYRALSKTKAAVLVEPGQAPAASV